MIEITSLSNDDYLKVRDVSNEETKFVTVQTLRSELLGGADALVFKGVIDCSINPNYPAADAGHVYKVSVAGKIGGASGPQVEAGDVLTCITDSSAAGNHASVGANWIITQANLVIDTDGTLAANSDALIPSQKAVKTYVDTLAGALLLSGIGASDAYDKTTAGAQELLAADPSDRVVLIVVQITETFDVGDGSATVFDIGETDTPEKFKADLNSGSAGDVLVFAGVLTGTKALLVTGVAATGTGTGAISVAVIALPSTS